MAGRNADPGAVARAWGAGVSGVGRAREGGAGRVCPSAASGTSAPSALACRAPRFATAPGRVSEPREIPILDRSLILPASVIIPFDDAVLIAHLSGIGLGFYDDGRGAAERVVECLRELVDTYTLGSPSGSEGMAAEQAASRWGTGDAYSWPVLAEDVAHELGVSVRRANQLAKHGALKAKKAGRAWMFDPRDVERFKDERNGDTGAAGALDA